MWWRTLITALLAAIVVLLVWDRERVIRLAQPGLTPHQAYARSLEEAGLSDTALARDWLAAAAEALAAPRAARVPLDTSAAHDPSRPRAEGYRFTLQRGRVLEIALTVEAAEPALVFIDLFRPTPEGPAHLVSADRGRLSLRHEITADGDYIVRIQPELLRGGALRITNQTTASLTFPVAGRDASAVRSYFRDPRDDGRREHHGVDIFAPRETPVLAAADGWVTSAGTNRLGGNVVWLWDPSRRQSQYYAHLSRQAVSAGQRVRAGEVIGYVGNTGNARGTPPHLHFGIYARSEGPIDPLPFVNGARGPQPAAGGSSSRSKPAQTSTGIGG